jgi:hypothetical protein
VIGVTVIFLRTRTGIPFLPPTSTRSSVTCNMVLEGIVANFSAWIGLVPKQNSSGGKDRLGNLIHGALHAGLGEGRHCRRTSEYQPYPQSEHSSKAVLCARATIGRAATTPRAVMNAPFHRPNLANLLGWSSRSGNHVSCPAAPRLRYSLHLRDLEPIHSKRERSPYRKIFPGSVRSH